MYLPSHRETRRDHRGDCATFDYIRSYSGTYICDACLINVPESLGSSDDGAIKGIKANTRESEIARPLGIIDVAWPPLV
jgi:hypothetical protein